MEGVYSVTTVLFLYQGTIKSLFLSISVTVTDEMVVLR